VVTLDSKLLFRVRFSLVIARPMSWIASALETSLQRSSSLTHQCLGLET